MPTYYTMNYPEGGLKLKLKPRGLCRRLFKECIPYLTGNELNLDLEVKSSFNSDKQCEYEWQLQDLLPDKTFRPITQGNGSFISKSQGTIEEHLGTHLILFEAEYHLIITFKCDGNVKKQTLLDFYAMARDVYCTRLVFNLMSGFVGAIIGLFVGLLLRRN